MQDEKLMEQELEGGHQKQRIKRKITSELNGIQIDSYPKGCRINERLNKILVHLEECCSFKKIDLYIHPE